jgi:hypothetical protein
MPYLNIDDGLDDDPRIDALSDVEFRALFTELFAWSRTGALPTDQLARELIATKCIRRAPRHWLPDAIKPPLRYRSKIPRRTRDSIFRRDGGACLHCGTKDDLTIDHIVPWSAGGSDHPANLQTLCRSCNARKGARI